MAIKSKPGRASLVIRNLDPAVKQRLRVRAAQRGRSMEAEARAILEQSVTGAAMPAARIFTTESGRGWAAMAAWTSSSRRVGLPVPFPGSIEPLMG